jgi:hypothetical protein
LDASDDSIRRPIASGGDFNINAGRRPRTEHDRRKQIHGE